MLKQISLARSLIRSKVAKKREISLTEIFKEQLKLSQFEKTMRRTYDPSTEGTKAQEHGFKYECIIIIIFK